MATRADDLHYFTVEDYLRLFNAEPDALERTELVSGVIFNVSPESWQHAQAVRYVDELLNEIYDGRSESHGSIWLSDTSLWTPDVYVLRPGFDGSRPYPVAADVELVVEICLSTQRRDLGPKFDVYAQERIPTYWAIQPIAPGWARRFRQPDRNIYMSVERFDLPNGYESLTVEMFKP